MRKDARMIMVAPIDGHVGSRVARRVPSHEIVFQRNHVCGDLPFPFPNRKVGAVLPNRVEVKGHVDGAAPAIGEHRDLFRRDAPAHFPDDKAIVMRENLVFEFVQVIP